jgi:RimJ/RimL family protein N-acetyltransferase
VRPAYPVQTDRLLLRPFAATDFDALLAIQSRADVARYLYWDPRTAAEVRETLDAKVRATAIVAEGDNLSLAAVLRESEELIGDCSLRWASAEHRQAEIGFVFHPDHHGYGYATEAAGALLALAFDELRAHRVFGRLEARNTASARVLERLGMRKEAHLVENEHVKGEWQSEVVYALLEREWLSRRRRGGAGSAADPRGTSA